jgi:hypothetical protein
MLTNFIWNIQAVGLPMEKPVDFKRFAEECLRLAANASTTEDKVILLKMGEVWLLLAEHAGAIQPFLDDPTPS